MLSDAKLDHIFHLFLLRTCLIFFFFLYVAIVHLLQIWEGVVIYCKLIPGWIKLNPARILFTAQWQTKFEILLGEVFKKCRRVIKQPASLYLDYLIATASWFFGPRLFPRRYHPIFQTYSTGITFWTHWFHHTTLFVIMEVGVGKLVSQSHYHRLIPMSQNLIPLTPPHK